MANRGLHQQMLYHNSGSANHSTESLASSIQDHQDGGRQGQVLSSSFQHNLDVSNVPRPHSAHPCLGSGGGGEPSSPSNHLLSPPGYNNEQRRSSMSGPCESYVSTPFIPGIMHNSNNQQQQQQNNLSTNLASLMQANSLPTSPHHNLYMGGNGGGNIPGGVSPDCGSMDSLLPNTCQPDGGGDGPAATMFNGIVDKKFAVVNSQSAGGSPMEMDRPPAGNSGGGAGGGAGGLNPGSGHNGENEETAEVWQDIVRQLAVS